MKCGKVKNPCKICFESVTNKNGLQCKGACKKWAHYKCLNFTPGKISDIKAGLIKITCPCPGCTTSEPKEILTNPPYTCTNQECPASQLPTCQSTDCPSKQKPIPQFQPYPTPPRPATPDLTQLPPCPPPEPKAATPPRIPTPPICPTPPRSCPTPPIKCPTPPRMAPSPPKKGSPNRYASPQRRPVSPRRRSDSPPIRPSSPTRRGSPQRKKNARPICPSCPMHCPKKSKGPQQANAEKLCPTQESRSCSLISTKSSESGKTCFDGLRSSSSDSELSNAHQYEKKVFCTIEEMCNTVGMLSDQLRDLMCKMMTAFENRK